MVRPYSSQYKSTLAAVNSDEAPCTLLKIYPASGINPVLVINDSDDLLVPEHGYFVACPFRLIPPDDFEGQLPKSQLSIDNLSDELMQWIEAGNGGVGSYVTFMQVMRSRPYLIEWSITMNLYNVRANQNVITAELGFENLFSSPACAMSYRPDNSPGLF